VLIDLPRDTRCWRNEIFGPAVSITPYRSFEQAIELANDSSLGLQAAIFTQRMDDILAAHALIEAGALIVNESPFFRAVQMPYGGVKDSGWGREGVTSAIQELTEERLLVVPLPETN
jgi:acyl-CoA reductase-like NAD-dependent aldehyde dehydrogenase